MASRRDKNSLGDIYPWNLALMIGSIQGPEMADILKVVRDHTDGGLGPLVQGCIEIRAIYGYWQP